MVLGTPSPVLFSSDDQAFNVPQGKKEIGYLGHGGAGGEGAKDKGFAAKIPGGWIDSTTASLGDPDKGDQCIMVRQLSPYGVYSPDRGAGDPL